MLFDLKAVCTQRGGDLFLPAFDDAGGDENAVRREIVPGKGGEGDDDVRDDVCQNEIVAAAERAAQRAVGE